MKQLRMIGLMLLAVFALGAFAASTAFAEEGLLPQQKEKVASGTGGAGTLETLAGKKITCEKVEILSILFLKESDIHGTADLHFKGCKAENLFSANTLLDEPGVILVKVLFLICLTKPAESKFGMLIEAEKEATTHIEVPGLGQLLLVKGAVIAENTSANKGKEFVLNLEGSKGTQKVATSCEIAGKKLSHTLVAALDSGTDEDASENVPAATAKTTLKFTEEVELMNT